MRTNDREDVVAEFHRAFGHPVDAPWTPTLLAFRWRLLGDEEMSETEAEVIEILMSLEEDRPITTAQRARLLKEMADVQYVLSGMAVALGLPLQEAFIRVHNSNMSKLGEDGNPIYREDGKVMKGPNYKEPDIMGLLK
jgi:predicted HAD superfamily Cof-like phosphohydrolase